MRQIVSMTTFLTIATLIMDVFDFIIIQNKKVFLNNPNFDFVLVVALLGFGDFITNVIDDLIIRKVKIGNLIEYLIPTFIWASAAVTLIGVYNYVDILVLQK
jgi:hypothetical protein